MLSFTIVSGWKSITLSACPESVKAGNPTVAGVGWAIRPPPSQNAFSTTPMIVHPTTLFTPSITVSDGFRIAKA
jgi:hypothetical protein